MFLFSALRAGKLGFETTSLNFFTSLEFSRVDRRYFRPLKLENFGDMEQFVFSIREIVRNRRFENRRMRRKIAGALRGALFHLGTRRVSTATVAYCPDLFLDVTRGCERSNGVSIRMSPCVCMYIRKDSYISTLHSSGHVRVLTYIQLLVFSCLDWPVIAIYRA